jgi:hypothetical protein
LKLADRDVAQLIILISSQTTITLSHSYFKGILWPSGPIHLIINTGIPGTLMMHTLEVLVQLSMGYGQLVLISFLLAVFALTP